MSNQINKEKEDIGGAVWSYKRLFIEDFDYEPGYIYDLQVMSKYAPNSEDIYGLKLKKVIAKVKVADNTKFEVNLRSHKTDLVTGNSSTGYKILNKIKIDCNNLCNEFTQIMSSSNENIAGEFMRNADGSYKLITLKIK